MADRVGQQLGNYRLVRLLGDGGYAEVYLGEHVYLGTQAAIKVLYTRHAREDIERFQHEARTIARLEHPSIVRVFDFGVQEGTPFLVMDYAPNGTLRERHPKGIPLLPDMIVPYVKQVAAALHYAHEQKVVHRDVKPENMLIGKQGQILLSDFGLAVIARTSQSQIAQEIGGTVVYMAPELLQGKARPASDQYALAVIVYQWLSGEWPFEGTYREIAFQHMLANPVPLRERAPALPPELETVVMTALAKDPKDRFASIRAFAHAFEQACQTGETTLPALTSKRPTQPQPDFSTQPDPGPVLAPKPLPPSWSPDNQQLEGALPQWLSEAPRTAPAPTFPPPRPYLGTPAFVAPRYTGSPPVAPGKAASGAGHGKARVAMLVALVLIILGGAGLAAGLILTHKSPTTSAHTGGTATPGVGHTATPGANIVFTVGSPCAQAAAHPNGPNATPGSYGAPALVYQAVGGSPAFLAASNGSGSVYYSDQTAQAIYVLSPATGHAYAVIPGVSQPSGVIISPDKPYPLYYLQQGATDSQAINENGQSIIASFEDSGVQIVPGFDPLSGFALGLNPVNDALLVPSPTNGTLACLSKGSSSVSTPFITGLTHPVAAAVDDQGNIYVADAGTNTIMRFNGQTGQLDWQQSFIAPQNIIVDADGYLVASLLDAAPGAGAVVRLNPMTGQLVAWLAKNLNEPRGLTLNTTFYHTNGIYFIDQGAATINELLYQAH